MEVDVQSLLQILGYLGIGALLTVLVQAYFLQRQRSRQYFRELVLTPDFLRFVGAMESLKMSVGEVSVDATIQEARALLADTSKAYEEHYQKLVSVGGTFFLPREIRTGLDGIIDELEKLDAFMSSGEKDELPGDALFLSIGAPPVLGVKLEEIRQFLKKYLGIPE
ncbi:MAG: hypothetical protein ABSF00_00985 [Candidatus Bathyarchaeia archaeon]